jgi:hypothetical protein
MQAKGLECATFNAHHPPPSLCIFKVFFFKAHQPLKHKTHPRKLYYTRPTTLSLSLSLSLSKVLCFCV